MKLSRGLTNYFASYPTEVPSGRPSRGQKVVLFPTPSSLGSSGRLPVPAFTVPAVIEALKKSDNYSVFTKIVPGEADAFCALHARSHGGVILTSDSDLLVHDLGQGGSVAFIGDMELRSGPKQTVVAAEYLPAHICARLSIPPEKGVPALAFELNSTPSLSFQKSVERCKAGVASTASPKEYDEFMRQYLSPEIAGSTLHNSLAVNSLAVNLDPRISELVLKSVDFTSRFPPIANGDLDSEVGIENAPMYLPFLLDSPSRTSAWETSRSVRQLAYGLLQVIIGRPIGQVVEFRRLQTPSGGLRVEVPRLSSLDSVCLDLIELMSRIRKLATQPEIQWVILSMYQDISTSATQGKRRPLSIQVFQVDAGGTLDMTSWEVIHFLAQVQGTLYSLRMLQQVVDLVSIYVDKVQPASFAELRSYLSQIPPLDEFPQLQGFSSLVQEIQRARSLAAFTTAFRFSDDIVEEINNALHPREVKRPKAPKQPQPIRNTPVSNNPFDILGLD